VVSESGGYVEARRLAPEAIAELTIDHEFLRIQQCIEALRGGSTRELLMGIPMI
jgi:hypothetical protein